MAKLTSFTQNGTTYIRVKRRVRGGESVVTVAFMDGENVDVIADKLTNLAKYLNDTLEPDPNDTP